MGLLLSLKMNTHVWELPKFDLLDLCTEFIMTIPSMLCEFSAFFEIHTREQAIESYIALLGELEVDISNKNGALNYSPTAQTAHRHKQFVVAEMGRYAWWQG